MSIALAIVVVAIGIGLFLFLRRGAGAPSVPADAGTPARPKAAPMEPEVRAPKEPTATPPPTKAATPAARAAPARDGGAARSAAPGAVPKEPAATPPPTATGAPEAPATAPSPFVIDARGSSTSAAPTPSDDEQRRDLETLKRALANTRDGFISRLARLFSRQEKIDAGLLDQIEEILLTADVGTQTSARILEQLRTRMRDGSLPDENAVWQCLHDQAVTILDVQRPTTRPAERPSLIMVVGVNGVGKTTTIGKLASRYVAEGKKVLLAAGDTYRAAAVLQLEVWGRRVTCPVVKGKENADPGSVIFDAVRRARAEGFDLVIADTAGRLHTKAPLMDELRKVERTCVKALEGRPPDEVLLVLDATTGQNAVQQAGMFREALGVTGIVLTKLDGTAKGGVILGVVHEHGIPVRYIGLGERVEDLREFGAGDFVEALFARPEGEPAAA